MKSVKIIYTLLMIFLATVLCQAQLPEHGDWRNRVGSVNPQKVKELYPLVFSKYSPITTGNETTPVDIEFYIDFRQLTALAPYCDYVFYSGHLYENQTSMYQRMFDSIADPAIRMMLVEDVIELGNTYVDHLDSINVVRELNTSTKGDPLTMPLAKIKRAHYNYLFAHDPKYYPAQFYDKEKAYNLYREAFMDFLAAKGDQGKELQGFYVQEYYKVCQDLYKSDEDRYYEQFLTDYQEIVRVCDKLLIPYYDIPDSIKNNLSDPGYALYRDYNYYTNASIKGGNSDDGIKAMFASTGAASADRFRTYFAPRLDANRHDKEYLDRAIQFMFENGITMDSLLYDYCKASYELGKTYNNCIGLANSAYIGLIDKSEMRDYYQDALNATTSEALRAKIRFLIARSLYTPRRPYTSLVNAKGGLIPYGQDTPEYQQWEKDTRDCNNNLELLLANSSDLLNDPSLDVRDYVAQAYYMLGMNHKVLAAVYASMNEADLSEVNFKRAKHIKASKINGRLVSVDSQIEDIKNVKKQISNHLAKKRNVAQEQRDYEEYIRKKKAEEAFWEMR